MDSIYFTSDHDIFRQTVRRFLDEEVAPHADQWEEARELPRSIWKRMGELGFLGISLPEEYGGSEADLFYDVVWMEEMPRSMMGGFCASVGVAQYMATAHILKHGAEDQKTRFLTPSIAGEYVGALGITEPDTGSDVAAIRTTAVLDGDHYVINGAKTFITNGAGADFVTLACKTTRGVGAAGISLIVVEADRPGFAVTRKLNKIGWHSSDTAELAFEDVRVPVENLIGQPDQGFYYIMDCFQMERLFGAAVAVGGSQLCLETTLRYVSERQAFGRPLARFQAIRHCLADLAAEIEAARHLTYHTAWLHSQGKTAIRESSMAKLYATELGKRVVDECLQFFGGFGYMEEYPIARMYRDVRVGTIVAGTSEIMREIIGRLMIDDQRPADVARTGLGAAAEVPSVGDLFGSLPGRLKAEAAPGAGGVFHFQIAGADQAEWTVRVADGECRVTAALEGEPDCLVEMDQKILLGLELGGLDPQTAFMSGKIKVSNVAGIMTYLNLFEPFRSG
ncbi:MAG: acyl-CoA dehydrogenase family protein [Proteobacteria bacterium]|nr:acyl-CoA dehydrogenase family protein [Pseudomonadota bacterium]